MRVLILHGWGGSDYPHWQAKLASEIAKNYGCVYFPKFTDVDNPKLDIWLKELKEAIDSFKPDTVVCHSLANNLWFWFSNRYNYNLKRLYLVATPSLTTQEKALESFFPTPQPPSLNAKEAIFVSSDNDKWCSLDEVKELSKKYGAKLKVIESGGHINPDSGFGSWDWIEREFGVKE